MKIRSKALYQYLLDADVLNGTKEAIAQAKREYRKQYKRHWKQTKRPRKEIRIEFTLKQYGIIKLKAYEYNLRPTTYARNVILEATGTARMIVDRDLLLQVLQLVSMATIATVKNTLPTSHISKLMQQAEIRLLEYININTL